MNGTRHTGTSVAVYKDLKEQILHLELPPGSAISEIDTAAAFHVSRTPVRDAFKMLEREGLLEVRPHIGTFVSLIDLNMISDILYLRETLEQAVLRDLTAGYDKSQEFRIRLLLQRQCGLLEQGNLLFWVGIFNMRLNKAISASMFKLVIPKFTAITA